MPAEMTAGVKEKPADFMSILQGVSSDTAQLLGGLEIKVKSKADQAMVKSIANIERGMEEASKIQDDRARKVRLQVLEADVRKLHEDAEQEERDVAEVVMGLHEMYAQIGVGWEELTKPTPAEQALITDAEAKLADAKRALTEAENSFFLGHNRRVAAAKQEIASAEVGIKRAKEEAARQGRSRLHNASMEMAMQQISTQSLKAVEIVSARREETKAEIRLITEAQGRALKAKLEVAGVLEAADKELNSLEPQLKLLEQELISLTNGTSEYVAKETEISNLRSRIEEIRGQRHVALKVFQTKEEGLKDLEIHAIAQRKTLDCQNLWIASLISEMQEQKVTFQSRLSAMKSISDLEAAKNLSDVSAEVVARNAEMMARIGATAEEISMKAIESHEARLRRIILAAGAQQESISVMRQRAQEVMKKYRETYGISPKIASFFSYGNEGATSEDQPATT